MSPVICLEKWKEVCSTCNMRHLEVKRQSGTLFNFITDTLVAITEFRCSGMSKTCRVCRGNVLTQSIDGLALGAITLLTHRTSAAVASTEVWLNFGNLAL